MRSSLVHSRKKYTAANKSLGTQGRLSTSLQTKLKETAIERDISRELQEARCVKKTEKTGY